jgi:uncharacterized protein DUF6544
MSWYSDVAFGLCGVAVLALAAVGLARQSFRRRVEMLERALALAPQASPRTDLPLEVIALARRLGVSADQGGRLVTLTQQGEMWLKPDSKPLPFTARQTSAVSDVNFLWQASSQMHGVSMRVIDYLVGSEGGLEVRLFGALPIVRAANDDTAFRGEAMRYLAEIMWNPEALLFNRQIDWRVVDARTLAAATGSGARRSEVRLILNESGDPVRAEADARPRADGGVLTLCPWFARCRDYQVIGGRRVPMEGEAGWVLAGAEFVYFRARILSWSQIGAAPRLEAAE